MSQMSLELWTLFGAFAVAAFSLLLQAFHLAATAGNAYIVSDRSGPAPQASPLAGRLARNVRNQMESMMLFIPLVAISELADISNAWTQISAIVFVGARALYAPLYALAISPLRTLVWNVGIVALLTYAWGILSAAALS